MQTAIVLGSARRQGNTEQLARCVSTLLNNATPSAPPTLVNLADYAVSGYDYQHHNRDDDFLVLMRRLLEYDRIVLATPMYWYACSGIMKTFLDRLSDLLSIEKEMGRQLRGKRAALLATGGDLEPPACFEDVFRRTWEYLGVKHEGMLYCHCADGFDPLLHQDAMQRFVEQIHAR